MPPLCNFQSALSKTQILSHCYREYVNFSFWQRVFLVQPTSVLYLASFSFHDSCLELLEFPQTECPPYCFCAFVHDIIVAHIPLVLFTFLTHELFTSFCCHSYVLSHKRISWIHQNNHSSFVSFLYLVHTSIYLLPYLIKYSILD